MSSCGDTGGRLLTPRSYNYCEAIPLLVYLISVVPSTVWCNYVALQSDLHERDFPLNLAKGATVSQSVYHLERNWTSFWSALTRCYFIIGDLEWAFCFYSLYSTLNIYMTLYNPQPTELITISSPPPPSPPARNTTTITTYRTFHYISFDFIHITDLNQLYKTLALKKQQHAHTSAIDNKNLAPPQSSSLCREPAGVTRAAP